MRLAMFGGSFDPVHLGHLILAEQCREQAQLDEVWFIPSATAPHKQNGATATDRQRIEMLRLATGGHPSFLVSDLEIQRKGVSYTVDTLATIREQHPEDELFFIIGGDSLEHFTTWKEPQTICELACPLVVARPGAAPIHFESLASLVSPDRFEQIKQYQIDCPLIEISSAGIRSRVADQHSIRFQVSRAVEKYIESQNLYGNGSC